MLFFLLKLFLVPLLLVLWGGLLLLCVLSIDSLLFALPFLGLIALLAAGGWFVGGAVGAVVPVASLLLVRIACFWPAWFSWRVPGSRRVRWCRVDFRVPGEYFGATLSLSLPLCLLSVLPPLTGLAQRYDRSRHLPPEKNLREALRVLREQGRGTRVEVNDEEAEILVTLE